MHFPIRYSGRDHDRLHTQFHLRRRCMFRECIVPLVAAWILGVAVTGLAAAEQSSGREQAPPNELSRQETPGTEPSGSGEDAKPEPETHTVRSKPVQVKVTLSGTFQSTKTAPVQLETEEWKELIVVEAIAHGESVRRDEVLVRCETDRIDREIHRLEAQVARSQISLEEKKLETRTLEKLAPLEVADLRLQKRHSEEDLRRFERAARPFAEQEARFQVKRADNYLAYQKEELRQLEKMYQADDLTEETEEIIVRRQRDAVNDAMFGVEKMRVLQDKQLESTLPRRQIQLEALLTKQSIALEKAEVALPARLEKTRLEVAALARDHSELEQKLERLRGDREALVVRAPMDGVVYYGKMNPDWSLANVARAKLIPGGRLDVRSVFMTVVATSPLRVHAKVDEKDLRDVRPGHAVRVVPAARPEQRIRSRVGEVSTLPLSPGEFVATVDVPHDAEADGLMPGMTCAVHVTAYTNPSAVTIPSAYLFNDPLDGEERFVYVKAAEGRVRRSVKAGRQFEKETEILSGLEAGDEIYTRELEGEG